MGKPLSAAAQKLQRATGMEFYETNFLLNGSSHTLPHKSAQKHTRSCMSTRVFTGALAQHENKLLKELQVELREEQELSKKDSKQFAESKNSQVRVVTPRHRGTA